MRAFHTLVLTGDSPPAIPPLPRDTLEPNRNPTQVGHEGNGYRQLGSKFSLASHDEMENGMPESRASGVDRGPLQGTARRTMPEAWQAHVVESIQGPTVGLFRPPDRS